MSCVPRRFPARRGGFTLIEVLVALVIVAVGMSALMSALGSSAQSVTYMQDKIFAEWVALNQIANDRLQLQQGQVPQAASSNGDLDYAGRSWHWRQDIVATQVPGIMRIDVKVRPKEVKGGDDDSWYVTVSGIAGSALAAPGSSEQMVAWDGSATTVGGPASSAGNGTVLGGANGTTGTTGQGTSSALGGSSQSGSPSTNPTTPPETSR